MSSSNFVFATEAEARNAIAIIDSLVRQRVTERSPESIDKGGIIGRNLGTGELALDAARSVTWAQPRQRKDSKWIVPVITDNYHPVLEGIDFLNAFSGYTIEEWDDLWFVP